MQSFRTKSKHTRYLPVQLIICPCNPRVRSRVWLEPEDAYADETCESLADEYRKQEDARADRRVPQSDLEVLWEVEEGGIEYDPA